MEDYLMISMAVCFPIMTLSLAVTTVVDVLWYRWTIKQDNSEPGEISNHKERHGQ